MPTGGVDPSEENLEKWFTAGATCVGMGSALITEKIVKTGDWNAIKVQGKRDTCHDQENQDIRLLNQPGMNRSSIIL